MEPHLLWINEVIYVILFTEKLCFYTIALVKIFLKQCVEFEFEITSSLSSIKYYKFEGTNFLLSIKHYKSQEQITIFMHIPINLCLPL